MMRKATKATPLSSFSRLSISYIDGNLRSIKKTKRCESMLLQRRKRLSITLLVRKENKKYMDITQNLIERAKSKGINTDKVVYSLCIGDIIECIADAYEEDALSFSESTLNELMKKGIKATEYISWSDTIESYIV
jgi:hypothetical protein